jgi:Restriction endonuclease
MAAGREAQRGRAAEEFLAELFRRLGYEVRRHVQVAGMHVDLVIQRDGLRSPVEIKIPRFGQLHLKELGHVAANLQSLTYLGDGFVSPIIVVFGETTNEAKHWTEGKFNLRIWDMHVLWEKTRPYKELHQNLTKLIGSEGTAPKLTTEQNQEEREEVARLIKQLENHEQNEDLSASEYEKLCLTVFTFLFGPHLYGFQIQAETSDGGNRYDFVCRIKSGDPFLDSIRHDFRTRSIIFECKNYKDPITADQVYSTERYLFSGALRTVCFLISRRGADEGCYRAAQGALRESGKLVLLLSNRDLVEMLRLKPEKDGPSSYLDEKIWEFITMLPR